MSSEARLAPSDRSSTDKRASISLATRSLGGTLDMGLVSSPVFSSANHFRGTRPFPFYRHSRTLPTPDVPVLKGISLDIGPGATAIIGQNGAGKSTFVRLLNGLLKPGQGEVLVNAVDTRASTVARLARTVGLVFQNPSDQLFKNRVLDEVMFGPLNLGVSAREAKDRAREALAQV